MEQSQPVMQSLTEEQTAAPLEKLVRVPAPFVFTRLPVRLHAYEGSAELLLWLLRRRLVDVGDVAVCEVVQQVGAMHSSPLQNADELAIASELVWLKSALLLPQPEIEVMEVTDEELLDGERLGRRLLSNAAYGLAAKFLSERSKVWSQMFPRPSEEDLLKPLKEVVIGDEPAMLLLKALQKLLARMTGIQVRIPRRRLTVPQCIKVVLQMLKTAPKGELTFDELCADCETILEVIITFLAVLELIRRTIVGARQDNPFAPIFVFLRNP